MPGLDANETAAAAAALGQGEIFRHVPPEARLRLASTGVPVHLAQGALLAQSGDPGDALYIVLDGEIEIRALSWDGRDLRLTSLGAGAVAGEMAVLDGGPRSADMIAARRSRLWRISRDALLGALASEPEAALALLAELSRRLRRTNDELKAKATLDLGGRLARVLLAEQSARGLVPLTQGELARRAGGSREKVNRKLRDWSTQGWVEVTPRGVRLLSAQRIAALTAEAQA